MTGRRNLKMWLTICSLMLVLVSPAPADTHYVNPGDSIQAAINAADPGDQIAVAPGTYNEAINFNGKAVHLYSSGGAATINGAGNYHVIQCVSGEGPGTILEGFTITGGNANGAYPNNCGGGMYNDYTSPTVKNCTFTGNSATSFGGGMYNHVCSPTVTDCTFSNNEATASAVAVGQGGGMHNSSSSPTVTRCTFTGNSAASFGGGMYNYFSNPIVTDCNFSNNETTDVLLATGQGGGMHNDNSSPTLTNCTFSGNTSRGAFVEPGKGGGMYNYHSNPTLTACIFNANTASCSGSTVFAGQGGGMHNSNSSPTLINCTFSKNTAGASSFGEELGVGGGMYNGEVSSPKVTNCTFSDNTDSGMFNELWSSPTVTGCSFSGKTDGMVIGVSSSPTVTNCTFSGNDPAGIWNKSSSNPKVTDCTFSWNWAGMQNDYLSSSTVTDCTFDGNLQGIWNKASSSSTVTHCTFTSNNEGIWNELLTSSTVTNCTFRQNSYAGMENWSCNPTVTNCVFMNNGYGIENMFSGPKVTNCTFTGNYTGIDNTICGPKITNCILWNNTLVQIGDHAVWTSVTYCDVQPDWGYYYPGAGNIYSDPKFADASGRLSPDSPCIDRGNNSAISGVATDLDRNGRIVDGNFDGDPVVDMGAYEAYEMLNTIHVPGDCATIQLAIDAAMSYYSQIEVAPGTYNEAINFKGKAIRLYSTGGPQVTTINGTGKGYHVVQCVNHERSSTILEGFTITGGNANGSAPHNRGGGMYNDLSGPTVTNCIFIGNTATYGGGMSNDNFSWPLITGCIFKGNSASNAGGGIANSENYGGIVTDCTFESNTASGFGGGVWNEYSNYQLTNCTFSGNQAGVFGGGMHNELYGTVGLTNCTFSSNSAGQRGGGMDNYYQSKAFLTNCTFTGNSAKMVGGGMYNWAMQSEAILTNCTFKGNSVPVGYSGGAMGNLDGSSILTNCTFTGNSGVYGGGGIHNLNGSATLTNCILWGDSPPEIRGSATVTYSDVQGGWTGTGNKNANPLFADGAGRLAPTSPCIDAGNNAAVSGVATDLDGKPRKTDGNLDGVAVVDMGAYEYVSVDADADGIKDSVDKAPLLYSNDFADGSTTGTIIDRADQLLVIVDAPAPYGVWIEASASGGPTPAQVGVCGDADIWFDAGDVAFVTCGSVEIAVVHGTVEITFVAADGTQVETSLNAGNAIAFEPETCIMTAPPTNVDDVVVVVDGREIIVNPGQSKMLPEVDIDIYPNRTPNMVYLSKNYTIPVVVFGSTSFNVTSLNSSTVRFGRTGTEAVPVRAPTIRDMNADGFPDAMYGFLTFNCGFQLGDTEGILTGSTTSGVLIEGRDSVLVSP